MSQKQAILKYLKRGRSITPIDALEKFGCFRLAARIDDLRQEGHKIITEIDQNQQGNRFARYRLVA